MFILNPYRFATWVPNWLLNNLISYYPSDTNWSFPDVHWSNNWTINGATFTASGKINWAYSFDAINDYISLWTALNINTTYSVFFWVKLNSLPTTGNLQSFLYKLNTAGTWPAFEFMIYNNSWTQQVFVSHATTFNPINYTLPTGSFIHLGVTYSANTITFYLNWSSIWTVSQSTAPSTSTNPLYIWRWAVWRYLDWTLDEVGIWNAALTTTQITTLYNGGPWLPYSSFTT